MTSLEIKSQTTKLKQYIQPKLRKGNKVGIFTRTKEHAPCTVEVSHKFESLHAHVRINNGAIIYPGDEVQVQGPEIMAPFGEVVTEDREAIILRASLLERLWTKTFGDFEVMELCEFSFSEEATL